MDCSEMTCRPAFIMLQRMAILLTKARAYSSVIYLSVAMSSPKRALNGHILITLSS